VVVHGKRVGIQRLTPVVRQASMRASKQNLNRTAINSVEKTLKKPIKKATPSRAQKSFTEGNLANDLSNDPWEQI
jgi:hypothetical protein